MTKLYTFICTCCGGDAVIWERPSRWSNKEQEWEYTDYTVKSNETWCDDCGDYHDIKRVEWHPILPEEVTK